MGIPVIDTGPFTVEEFYAFTDHRPDDEKWELIDGELILNASPSLFHQRILKNLIRVLANLELQTGAGWEAVPGIGVRVSDTSRPEPDVMILPRGSDPARRDTTEALAVFEIMSPSTADRDLKWKRAAYTGMAKLAYYVAIAQDTPEAVVFAREEGFAERRLCRAEEAIEMPALGLSLPLAEIYRDTGLL